AEMPRGPREQEVQRRGALRVVHDREHLPEPMSVDDVVQVQLVAHDGLPHNPGAQREGDRGERRHAQRRPPRLRRRARRSPHLPLAGQPPTMVPTTEHTWSAWWWLARNTPVTAGLA